MKILTKFFSMIFAQFPDNDIQIVKIVHNDKIKSTVVDTCSISVVEFKIAIILRRDMIMRNIVIPDIKGFSMMNCKFQTFKTFREARAITIRSEQIDINKA